MAESAAERVLRGAKKRTVALAYRTYATLLMEHERVRRAAWHVERDAPWTPSLPAWKTLRFLLAVHDPERRAARVLAERLEQCGAKEEEKRGARTREGKTEETETGSRTKEGKTERTETGSRTRTRSRSRTREGKAEETETGSRTSETGRVPWLAWREALRAGIDLVADVVVAHGAELPWGQGNRRAPRSRQHFEAVCRFLRDRDVGDDALASLAEILDSAELRPLPPRRPASDHSVIFYRGRQVLSVDRVRMALPMGRELLFLELLAERRCHAEVTPRFEHEIDWKNAVEQLRRRIRKGTGHDLLRALVLSARGAAGGYRLAPGVRVRGD